MLTYTVCVLLYGSYPQLANRCLSSLAKLPSTVPIRIAMNETSRAVKDEVDKLAEQRSIEIVLDNPNIHKYPAMRQLFYNVPLESDCVMWFDDDSYITTTDVLGWLNTVDEQMQEADMLGKLYKIRMIGGQSRWVENQPWYTRQPVSPSHVVTFATGGWWVCRTKILQNHNWPIPELDHRGGDVMLGELMKQQGYRLKQFTGAGIAVNADEKGVDSKSPRRGFNQMPIGSDYF